MKHTRRFVTLIIVLAMVMMMAVSASAAVNNSITINNAKAGETYALYKLFDLAVDSNENPTKYTYTVNEDWTSFFAGEGASYVTINGAGAVTAISDAAGLANAAEKWASKPTATQTVTVAAGATTAEFTGLANGYWLITSTVGTAAMTETTPDKAAVTINEKNIAPEITKVADKTTANIDDTINYTITITAGTGAKNYKLVDVLDNGLVAPTAVNVTCDNPALTMPTPVINANQITVDFKDVVFANGDKVTITYAAKLDTDAVIADEGNKNTATLTYGDNNSLSVNDSVAVNSYQITLTKQNAEATPQKLAGAKFKLYDAKTNGNEIPVVLVSGTGDASSTENNVYRHAKSGETAVEMVTGTTGVIVVQGLANDEYFFEETQQPEGYNILTERTDAVVIADANKDDVVVVNQSGSELPSTGGMGTTIFYILGGLLAVGALVVLVTNKRMRGTN